MKPCTICKQIKDLSMFCKEKQNKDGRGSRCKECNRKVSYEWQKTNPELRKIQSQLDNTNNRNKRQSKQNEWAKNNPGLINAKSMKRHSDKLQRTPKWLTKSDLIEMRWAYKYAIQLTKETGIKYHVDHIIPLRGENISGLHCPQNLRVIPAQENLLKSNRFESCL